MKALNDQGDQLQAAAISRTCLVLAAACLRDARMAAVLGGAGNYTLDLFDQLIDNTLRMQGHMRWH